MWPGTPINRTWHISILSYPQPVDMLKQVGMVRNAYQWYLAHLNTSLSVSCNHVSIERHGRKLLVTILGTSQQFLIPSQQTCLNLEKLLVKSLIAIDTSQYFYILSQQTCWNRQIWTGMIINRTLHISILPFLSLQV